MRLANRKRYAALLLAPEQNRQFCSGDVVVIDGERAKELHREAYAHQMRCTICAAILCLAGGSLVTWKITEALPILGVPIGILAAAVLVFVPMVTWALTEPVSHDLEEFAELMANELRQ